MARTPKDERPLTEAELKAPITKVNFYPRAKHFIKQLGSDAKLPVIKPGSEAWNVWRQYFERHLQWVPLVMQKLIDDAPDKSGEGMTVPTEFPQYFDSAFIESVDWKAPEPPRMAPRELRERLEELRLRYGPNWGIKDLGALKQLPKRNWRPPTDDELRARYRRQDAAE